MPDIFRSTEDKILFLMPWHRGQDQLAKDIGSTERTVRRHISKLTAEGLIERTGRVANGAAWKYELTKAGEKARQQIINAFPAHKSEPGRLAGMVKMAGRYAHVQEPVAGMDVVPPESRPSTEMPSEQGLRNFLPAGQPRQLSYIDDIKTTAGSRTIEYDSCRSVAAGQGPHSETETEERSVKPVRGTPSHPEGDCSRPLSCSLCWLRLWSCGREEVFYMAIESTRGYEPGWDEKAEYRRFIDHAASQGYEVGQRLQKASYDKDRALGFIKSIIHRVSVRCSECDFDLAFHTQLLGRMCVWANCDGHWVIDLSRVRRVIDFDVEDWEEKAIARRERGRESAWD